MSCPVRAGSLRSRRNVSQRHNCQVSSYGLELIGARVGARRGGRVPGLPCRPTAALGAPGERSRSSLFVLDRSIVKVWAYHLSIRARDPETGIQAIAVIAWLALAMTITMHGAAFARSCMAHRPRAASDDGRSEDRAVADCDDRPARRVVFR